MFDIGFSELLLVAVVAMLVIGPKRLPETARTVGLWIGRFKRKAGEVKRSVESELGMEEVREQLHLERIQAARSGGSVGLDGKLRMPEPEAQAQAPAVPQQGATHEARS